MPIVVNGREVPEQLVQREAEGIARDPRWQAIADPAERAASIKQAAEFGAVNRILVAQVSENDPRPVETALIESEVEGLKKQNRCREAFDDGLVRQHVERRLRMERTVREFTAGAIKPSLLDIQAFYDANRANFASLAKFQASHIVKHVNETQTEEQALAGIQEAMAALEAGEEFASVATRLSDCKDNGGDLGTFEAGVMVEEFEAAIRSLRPGQRTGVFKTPFGYHIAELRARHAGGVARFEDVRPDIEKVLESVFKHRELMRAINNLREYADIRRVEDLQPEPVEPLQKASSSTE